MLYIGRLIHGSLKTAFPSNELFLMPVTYCLLIHMYLYGATSQHSDFQNYTKLGLVQHFSGVRYHNLFSQMNNLKNPFRLKTLVAFTVWHTINKADFQLLYTASHKLQSKYMFRIAMG